jgi:hypothetical protein
MSHAILSLSGWGLFYGGLILYVVWVIAERTFFTGRDPERWDPKASDVTTLRGPRSMDRLSAPSPLGRAA